MTVSRRDILAGASGALVAGSAPFAFTLDAESDRWRAVERLCQQMIADHRAPGLSLAVAQRGAILYRQGFGLADVERDLAVEADTTFRTASVTKPFIAALFLLLQREGALRLDEPMARWLPAFPRAREVTLRMLLNHTSGLGEYTQVPLERLIALAGRDYDNEALVAQMAAVEPLYVRAPGTGWRYSNTGYVLLGVIAEMAGGRSIATLLSDKLFEPLGLRASGWDAPDAGRAGARGYARRQGRWTRIPYVSASFVGASGAVRSTASELCMWQQALYGGQVLTSEELADMLAPARVSDGRPARPDQCCGLATFSGEAFGMRVVWHSGNTAGFAADARHYPEPGVSIAMLANTDASRMGTTPRDLRRAILQALSLA